MATSQVGSCNHKQCFWSRQSCPPPMKSQYRYNKIMKIKQSHFDICYVNLQSNVKNPQTHIKPILQNRKKWLKCKNMSKKLTTTGIRNSCILKSRKRSAICTLIITMWVNNDHKQQSVRKDRMNRKKKQKQTNTQKRQKQSTVEIITAPNKRSVAGVFKESWKWHKNKLQCFCAQILMAS